MATSTGSLIIPSDYAALFTTLETIRAKHAARKEARNTTQLRDTTLGGYRSSVTSGSTATAAQMEKVRNAVNFLGNYAVDLTTTFASNITAPRVGDLIKSTNITTMRTQIDAMNNVCAFCSFNSSFDSSYRASYRASYRSSYNSGFDSGYNSGAFGSFNSSWNGVFC